MTNIKEILNHVAEKLAERDKCGRIGRNIIIDYDEWLEVFAGLNEEYATSELNDLQSRISELEAENELLKKSIPVANIPSVWFNEKRPEWESVTVTSTSERLK